MGLNRNYEDMYEMEHPISRKHPRMSRSDRAAQFSPFAALTGYEDMIEDAGRENALAEDSVIFTQDDIDSI